MNDITDVKALTVSLDRKLAAVSVRIKGKESVAMVYVYEIDSDVSIRPKTLSFTDEELNKAKGSGPLHLFFTCLSFSADSKVLAGTTNMPAAGVAVFDWELEKVIRVIPTKAPIYHISFNPGSNAKFCVSGTAGTFEFWHYSARVAHVAPIEGIDNTMGETFDFTCIEWISSDCIVAGTKSGQLSLVLGCKQMHVYSAFDLDSDPTPKYSQTPVVKFLVKGSSLICFSSDNRASIFEIKPVLYSAGINGFELELMHRFKFGKIADVNGAAWSSQHPKDLLVIVSSSSGFYKYDLKSVENLLEFESAATDVALDDASLSLDGTESLASSSLESLSALKSLGPSALAARANRQVQMRRKKNFLSGLLWGVLRPTKVILRTHSAAI
jgi:WD40 repeat protein